MRPNHLSIPSSSSASGDYYQQAATPQWAASNKYNQFPKMSRLDQLLCRNQEIYQNMRNQLQEITRSNQNIDANISNIKPYYESREYGTQPHDENEARYFEDKDSYTFENKSNSPSNKNYNNQSNRDLQLKSQRSQRSQRTEKADKTLIESSTRISNTKNNSYYLNSNSISDKKTVKYDESVDLIRNIGGNAHQENRNLYKVPSIGHSSSFHDMDSSPIESEGHITQSIRGVLYQKSSDISNISKVSKGQNSYDNPNSSRRYQTFEQSDGNNLYRVDQNAQYMQNKQNIMQPILPQPQSPQRHPSPNPLSLIFIPFNRLYSSPILQQTNKRQLLLARRSKTQVIPGNNSINRIINGIKYKNVNLCTEETELYQKIVNYVRSYASGGRNKGVDVGILGARNCLKKKLHYGMLAHIYEHMLDKINCYFSESLAKSKLPNLKFTIEHQQQLSLNTPTMQSYTVSLTQNQPQNQISLLNMQALIEKIFESMSSKYHNSTLNSNLNSNINLNANTNDQNHNLNCIRVTRLTLETLDAETGDVMEKISNVKIISTNKMDPEFVEELSLDVAVWGVNPLVRYHAQTQKVLDCFAQYRDRNRLKHGQ